MGYYVSIASSTCKLPAKNKDEAFERMCKLNFDNSIKDGGSYPRPVAPNHIPNKNVWFSWMEWNYHETCKSAREILEMLGFDCDEYDDHIGIDFYDSKTGQENLFFEAIADLLEGEIEWEGEDGSRWKWVFGPNGMECKTGKVIYS